MELDENVLRFISEETDIPLEEITADTNLYDDLDMDSLDFINVVVKFE